MNKAELNKQLGIKWFTFYTKIRPWILCISAVLSIVNLFYNEELDLMFYLQSGWKYISRFWWVFISLSGTIVQAILSVIVAEKADGNYVKFVGFVKGVLLFEVVNIACQLAIQQYIEYGLSRGKWIKLIVLFVLFLIVGYFMWYRLNIKYFKKRILRYASESEKSDLLMDPNNNYDIFVTTNVNFCRKCGKKLTSDSVFCSNCGTKVINDE